MTPHTESVPVPAIRTDTHAFETPMFMCVCVWAINRRVRAWNCFEMCVVVEGGSNTQVFRARTRVGWEAVPYVRALCTSPHSPEKRTHNAQASMPHITCCSHSTGTYRHVRTYCAGNRNVCHTMGVACVSVCVDQPSVRILHLCLRRSAIGMHFYRVAAEYLLRFSHTKHGPTKRTWYSDAGKALPVLPITPVGFACNFLQYSWNSWIRPNHDDIHIIFLINCCHFEDKLN